MSVGSNADRAFFRRLSRAARVALSNSPSVTARRWFDRARRYVVDSRRRTADLVDTSFGLTGIGELRRHLGRLTTAADPGRLAEMHVLAHHWCEHRFDLLGSGWVQVAHGVGVAGVEGNRYHVTELHVPEPNGEWIFGSTNTANAVRSREVWRLIEQPYRAIDWQLDFKSGHRWSERQWYRDIAIGTLPGVDIKVPWELARMQHLPALAVLFALEHEAPGRTHIADTYRREFRNQVLDFIATNPPRWGVNWYHSMEVGIRLANWLVAYDLFRAHGAEFDADFERVLLGSVWDHAKHIAGNLEWDPVLRGNHYLSNVVGLLFAAAYLPVTSESSGWLSWARAELAAEIANQFFPDGGNVEASTSYHRLSAELALYGAALLLGLDDSGADAISRSASARLERAIEFTMAITTPAGGVVQIGDNDSGRLFRLVPAYEQMTVRDARAGYANLAEYDGLSDDETYLLERHLDHRQLAAVAGALFAREDFLAFADAGWVDAEIVSMLARGRHLPLLPVDERRAAGHVAIADHAGDRSDFARFPDAPDAIYDFPVPGGGAQSGLTCVTFPDFGIYVYRSARVFVTVRCGGTHAAGITGHAHNDQLSVELWIDGHPIARDPGTYLYTSLPFRRDQYRSVRAHFAPKVGDEEQGRMDTGLFNLPPSGNARCVVYEAQRFVGYYSGYSVPVWREVVIGEQCVQIRDYGTATTTRNAAEASCTVNRSPLESPAFSSGYGWQRA